MATSATALQEAKLARLAEEYDCSTGELLIEYGLESVVPGICMNEGCNYTTEYEPDQREGWCEECDTETVTSFLVLMGML
jgi:hypothetical protein